MENREIKPNQAAFAAVATDGRTLHHHYGLTKREYFAAMAMQTLCGEYKSPAQISTMAEHAVECADALITELNKQANE